MVVSCFILQFVVGVCALCWEYWSWGYELVGAWGEQSRVRGIAAAWTVGRGEVLAAGELGFWDHCSGLAACVALGTATLKLLRSLQAKRLDTASARKGPFHAPRVEVRLLPHVSAGITHRGWAKGFLTSPVLVCVPQLLLHCSPQQQGNSCACVKALQTPPHV